MNKSQSKVDKKKVAVVVGKTTLSAAIAHVLSSQNAVQCEHEWEGHEGDSGPAGWQEVTICKKCGEVE